MKKTILTNSMMLIIFALFLTNCSENTNSTSKSEEKYESQSLTCSECGKSFLKSNGVQLSGHSEVFCGQTCATNWAWSHNIGVK